MRKPVSNHGGFTLIEMILAAAIFLILAGGIYFSVSTSVAAADELGREQIESRQNGSLIRFLRQGFLNLPVEAEIGLSTRNSGSQGNSVDLIIRRAPGAFSTGALDALGSGVALSVLPDGKGQSTISITRFAEKLTENELTRYLEDATWLPLMDRVQTIRWRFWDGTQQTWVELWERKDTHPEMIELTLRRAGELEKANVFRLPKLSQNTVAERASPSPRPEEGQ